MAFKQFTQCVDVKDFDPRDPVVQVALRALGVNLPAGVFAALMVALAHSSPWCLAWLAWLYVVTAILLYCEWFLYGRLICIPAPPDQPADSGGDHLVIGTLINILLPEAVMDNDYSIGILPQGMPLFMSLPDVEGSPSPYAYLMKNQDVTKNFPLLFTGHDDLDTNPKNCPINQKRSQDLHCEFEGGGMYDLDVAAQIAYVLALATVFACLIPKVGWIVALILAGLSLLILGIGLLLGLDGGDPNDVNPSVGEFHLNNCCHTGADTLIVKGRWVYDSGHIFALVNHVPFLGHQQPGAWNELHPITFCCKANGDGPDVILLRNRWQAAIGDATSPATLASQAQPQNQWQVHPLLDGCQPPIIV
jgi:hypothetical protein